jgi:ketosteroid isomerase-like protein
MMTNANAGEQTEKTLARHWRDFNAGDVDAIMADYAADAILVTAQGTRKGHAEIRGGFMRLFAEIFPPKSSSTKLEKQVVEGELAYIIWSGSSPKFNIPFATDTFVVRDGKIVMQTFAAQMEPK